MFGDIKDIFELFLDRSRSLSQRAAFFIILVSLAFLVDYCFNISYSFYITNKLNNLESVNRLKTIYQRDTVQFEKLLIVENKLLNKQHYLDFISRQLSRIDFISSKVPQTNHQINSVNNSPNNTIRSRFWMIISSNFFFVIFFLFFIFFPIYNKDVQDKNTILGWFAALIVITVLIVTITLIAYQIPILFHDPLWNYILNFIIHLFFISLLIRLATKSKKN